VEVAGPVKVLLFQALIGERHIPLGLLYIAKTLEGKGVLVKICDPNLFLNSEGHGLIQEKTIRDLCGGFDLIGFSSYRYSFPADRALMNYAKTPERTVIAGGWGPTIDPDLYLDNSSADLLVLGVHMQALETMGEIVDLLEGRINIDQTHGIAYRRRGEKVKTMRIFPPEAPALDWKIGRYGLDVEEYKERGTLIVPVLGAIASCPNYYGDGCLYCSIAKIIQGYKGELKEGFVKLSERLRAFDVDRIMQDMENALMELEAERICFSFVDDAMTPKNFRKLYEALLKEDLIDTIDSIKFQTRPDLAISILRQIKEKHRGKFIVDVGLEFYSQRDLDFCRRNITRKQMDAAIRALKGFKQWKAYTILTTPVSSALDVEENILLNLRCIEAGALTSPNPCLQEPGSLLLDILSPENLVYDSQGGVKLAKRFRLLNDHKNILAMIEKYKAMVKKKIEESAKEREEYLSSFKASADELQRMADRLELDMRILGKAESYQELLDSLTKLERIVQEDYEHYTKLKGTLIS